MTDRRVINGPEALIRCLNSNLYPVTLAAGVELLPQEEMVRRIEIARGREPGPTDTRRCCHCKQVKRLVDDFHRNRGKRFGRDHVCKTCKRASNAAVKQDRKRRQFRAVLGRAS